METLDVLAIFAAGVALGTVLSVLSVRWLLRQRGQNERTYL